MKVCKAIGSNNNEKNLLSQFIVMILTITMTISAQEKTKKTADEIARELSNPVGSLSTVIIQGTYTHWGGSVEGAASQNTGALILMPVIPVPLKTGSLIFRPSFPVASAPYINENGEWDKEVEFGDIGLMAVYGYTFKAGLIVGAGPTMFFPTAGGSRIGKDQFQLGPTALAAYIQKWGVLGFLWQHWWGVGSIPEDQEKVNVSTIQLFYWFGIGNGWQIGGSPTPTANYVAAAETSYSIPLNLGIAKTVIIGEMPLKFTIQGQYFVTRPEDLGTDWGIFFQVAPVLELPW